LLLYRTPWLSPNTHTMKQKSKCYIIRYDTIEEFNGQFNLAHVTKNKKYVYKKETKTNKRLCPLSPVQVRESSQKTRT